jgi:biopolymer transport protein ExbB/TolQ
MLEMIAESFILGGFWMYIILAVSVFALGIIIERAVSLVFKYNINAEAFMAQIQKLIMSNNIDRAVKLCNTAPDAALSRVVKAGLTKASKGEIEIINSVEETTLEVIPLLTKRTSSLITLANTATLMGLLGTIVGMILAFKGLKDVSADKRQEVLSIGISVAMYTTAFGLIVAIPSILAHLVLNNMTKKIIDEIDHYSVKLENLLVTRLKGGVPAQEPAQRDSSPAVPSA